MSYVYVVVFLQKNTHLGLMAVSLRYVQVLIHIICTLYIYSREYNTGSKRTMHAFFFVDGYLPNLNNGIEKCKLRALVCWVAPNIRFRLPDIQLEKTV